MTRMRSSRLLLALLVGSSAILITPVAAGPRQLGELCKIAKPAQAREEGDSSDTDSSDDEVDETCAAGLDCIPAPIRRKCFPVSCAVEAVQKALDVTGFDLANYGQNMMDQAGITMQSPMFRPFPSNDNLNVLDPESSDLKRFFDVTYNNPPPTDVIVRFFDECTGGNANSNYRATKSGLTRKLLQEEFQEFRRKGGGGAAAAAEATAAAHKDFQLNNKETVVHPTTTTTDPRLNLDDLDNLRKRRGLQQEQPTPRQNPYSFYYGVSWEVGALATYNGDAFWASNVDNATTPQINVINNCFGFIIGYDAGVGALLGFGFTGEPAQLTDGCKNMFPIFETGPFALQVGFIDCEDPIALIELTLGASAGVSLPGYTSCTTTNLS